MKLKGFTILELVMVMALMTIVIGFSYTAWNILENNFTRYAKESNKLINAVHFSALIEKDFNDASKANIKENHLLLENNNMLIEYSFEASQVNRNVFIQQEKFTSIIEVEHAAIETYYQGQMINLGIVDYCTITYSIAENKNIIILQKEYSSDDLIRQQEYVH